MPDSTARRASGIFGYLTNHCSDRRDSMGTSARSENRRVFVGFLFEQVSGLLQQFGGEFARLKAFDAGERAGEVVHETVRAHHIDLREVVGAGRFRSRCGRVPGHLECAGAEILFHGRIEDDGDFLRADGAAYMQAVQVRVTRVVRVDGDGDVARDGLRACR